MDRIVIDLPGLSLHGTNELIRMNPHQYRKYREGICHHVARALPRDQRPAKPFRAYKLVIHMTRPTPFDVDNKHGAVKPLIDVLRRMHPRNNPHGLDVLFDDTDGEHGLPGACRELRAGQAVGRPRLLVDIREVRS